MRTDIRLDCSERAWELGFRAAIGDLVGNVQPWKDLRGEVRTVLLAGLHYDRPWTRDAAINSWNGLSLLWPEVAVDTLRSVLVEDEHGLRVGGQYWDAVIWLPAAWNHWLVTHDRGFLAEAYTVARNSLAHAIAHEFDEVDGLFRGPGCFLDGISAYPERYRDPDDWACGVADWPSRYRDRCADTGAGFPAKVLSTNCVHLAAFRAATAMAHALGLTPNPDWEVRAVNLRKAIRATYWRPDEARLDFLVDPWGESPHQEGLGYAFALLFGVLDDDEARALLAKTHREAAGLPCLWPVHERYAALGEPSLGQQSGTIWPQVNAFWAEACARHGARAEAAAELDRLAKAAFRDGHFWEIYHPVTGESRTFWQEAPSISDYKPWKPQPRQSWCATGYVRMLLATCFGWSVDAKGYRLEPWLPVGVDHLAIRGLTFRGRNLDLAIARDSSGAVVVRD